MATTAAQLAGGRRTGQGAAGAEGGNRKGVFSRAEAGSTRGQLVVGLVRTEAWAELKSRGQKTSVFRVVPFVGWNRGRESLREYLDEVTL